MTPPRPRFRPASSALTTHFVAAAAGAGLLALALWLSGWLSTSRRPGGWLDPVTTPAARYAWTTQPEPAFPIPPYARHLKDVRIVLDPGHGGRGERRGWKVGPTGLREAEINLRVARLLRDFLKAVGAEVHLTREADVHLDADMSADNEKRIALANALGADLFLSIHHNGADQPAPNYTALFYHGSPDDSPASRCAARHLLTGLNDALRLEQHLSCAVLSDRVLFQDGLLVLREARVPAVLVEACFHSNPEEERRLRDSVHNRREAYGYFLGLARWAQAGLPRIRLVRPEVAAVRRGQTLVVALDDGLRARGGWGSNTLRIAADSLVVRVDGKPASFRVDLNEGKLRVDTPVRLRGPALRLFVDFENVFGQHVLHPRLDLTLIGG